MARHGYTRYMHIAPPFTSRTLKWVAVILMIGDHVAFFFPSVFSIWFRYIARAVAPIFLWLAVENVIRTSDSKKYLFRLALGAVSMWIGSTVVLLVGYSMKKNAYPILLEINIFSSLFVASALSFAYSKKHLVPLSFRYLGYGIAAILPFYLGGYIEGGTRYIFLAYIFILFRKNSRLLIVASLTYTVILAIQSYATFGNLTTDYQWMWFTSLICIFLTNNKHEKVRSVEKYSFYVLYPLSIWIPYLLKIFW